MPLTTPDAKSLLWEDGGQIEIDFLRTDSLNGTITWNIPENAHVYNGILVIISSEELTTSESPLDGKKYIASYDLNAPADMVGDSQVIGAFYNDLITSTMNVTGLDPDAVYYVAGFAVDNVLNYYSDGSKSYTQYVNTKSNSGSIPQSDDSPANPEVGQVYFNIGEHKVYMWTGGAWIEASNDPVVTGTVLPSSAQSGEFFYSTNLNRLFIWDGTQWSHANTADEGISMSQKIGIGTDGSSDEGAHVKMNLKRNLGWPTVCVELSEEHFNLALDKGLSEFRRRADNAYHKKFFVVESINKQQTYYLNDPIVGTDKVVDIIKISPVSGLGLATFGADDGIYAQQLLSSLTNHGAFDLTTIHAISEWSETYNKMFAREIDFTFRESTRELTLFRRLGSGERIVLEGVCERPEQELYLDRYAGEWIEDWAQAELMLILGLMIRDKFTTIPGPNGGTQMNGAQLTAQANQDFEELKRQLIDFEAGNGTEFGPLFVIG